MGQYVGLEHPDVVEQIVREQVPAEWRNEAVAEGGARRVDRAACSPMTLSASVTSVRRCATTGQDLLASVGIIEEKADIDDILDDSLIEEINDFDRAEIDEAVEQWQQENGG